MPPRIRCGACYHLRRVCEQDCPFADYFPPNDPLTDEKFKKVRKLYGVDNVRKMITAAPDPAQRKTLVESLIWEAENRELYPIHGSKRPLDNLQHAHTACEQEIYTLKAEVVSLEQKLQQQQQLQQLLATRMLDSAPACPSAHHPLLGVTDPGGHILNLGTRQLSNVDHSIPNSSPKVGQIEDHLDISSSPLLVFNPPQGEMGVLQQRTGFYDSPNPRLPTTSDSLGPPLQQQQQLLAIDSVQTCPSAHPLLGATERGGHILNLGTRQLSNVGHSIPNSSPKVGQIEDHLDISSSPLLVFNPPQGEMGVLQQQTGFYDSSIPRLPTTSDDRGGHILNLGTRQRLSAGHSIPNSSPEVGQIEDHLNNSSSPLLVFNPPQAWGEMGVLQQQTGFYGSPNPTMPTTSNDLGLLPGFYSESWQNLPFPQGQNLSNSPHPGQFPSHTQSSSEDSRLLTIPCFEPETNATYPTSSSSFPREHGHTASTSRHLGLLQGFYSESQGNLSFPQGQNLSNSPHPGQFPSHTQSSSEDSRLLTIPRFEPETNATYPTSSSSFPTEHGHTASTSHCLGLQFSSHSRVLQRTSEVFEPNRNASNPTTSSSFSTDH